jgi:hypothetical protein
MQPALAFDENGLLPVGDHLLTLEQLAGSMLVTGPQDAPPTWDAAWRLQLVHNLGIVVQQLWQVGISNISIDGSFVEDTDHPHDLDGYFECDPGQFVRGQLQQVRQLDPDGVWTWDWSRAQRSPDSITPKLPRWHQYRVELFPYFPGQSCGILDQFGNDLEFPSAFRQTRGFLPKGMIKIIR